ncbi:hypothetical protein FS749_014166 [Ceratobasidium sp. UAMH 11750]|nr:hypothetical protein FS749_014166 [Ceratobasidium sp. UAMH 11750]
MTSVVMGVIMHMIISRIIGMNIIISAIMSTIMTMMMRMINDIMMNLNDHGNVQFASASYSVWEPENQSAVMPVPKLYEDWAPNQ